MHPKYFKKNNVSSLFYRRRNDNVWSHYSKHGYNARHLIGINNVTEITLCNYTLTPVYSLNICKSKLSKPVVLVLTHAWGGGTELFEDELLLFTQFHFIFYRFDWKMNHMQLHAYYQQNKVYKSYWLPPPREIVQVRTISFFIFFTPMIDDFRNLSYDLLLVDFLNPIPELLRYVKTINKPFIYAMHDHHAVKYDLENDMHLGCTTPAIADRYVNYTNGMSLDERHRWEFAEVSFHQLNYLFLLHLLTDTAKGSVSNHSEPAQQGALLIVLSRNFSFCRS